MLPYHHNQDEIVHYLEHQLPAMVKPSELVVMAHLSVLNVPIVGCVEQWQLLVTADCWLYFWGLK